MIRTIWKYELTLNKLNGGILIPHGAQVLDVQEQQGIPCMWVLVNPEEKRMDTLEVYGTGHEIPVDRDSLLKKHIATLQYVQGQLVFHLFL